MPDVTIPADDAKAWADSLRRVVATGHNCPAHLDALADLLDPRPASLREQVLRAITESYSDEVADVVLAVVADWLANQPLPCGYDTTAEARTAEYQRAHDVALIRGGAE